MAHITSQITEVVNSPERGLTIIVRGKGTLSIGHFHVHIFHFSSFYASSSCVYNRRRKRSVISRHGTVLGKLTDKASMQHVPTRFSGWIFNTSGDLKISNSNETGLLQFNLLVGDSNIMYLAWSWFATVWCSAVLVSTCWTKRFVVRPRTQRNKISNLYASQCRPRQLRQDTRAHYWPRKNTGWWS